MKISRVVLWFFLSILLTSAATAMAQVSADLEKTREECIKSFKRIGLNTAPEDAAFLRILVESSKAKRGLEIGTATGFGAMNMGLAFERNGGRLTTVDIDPKMVKTARASLEKMQLQKTVTVVEGDALKVIPALEGPFDFVFIDAVKKDYLKYFKDVEPKLEPGAVIVADNVIQSAADVRDFMEAVENDPRYHVVTIRASELKKDGMAVVYKLK
jgi:predicted O-methyltransferase YrrM